MSLTLAKIWTSLPSPVRSLAAKSFFAHDPNDGASRLQAEVAIARAIKARDVFVRRLPEEKKIAYLATAVRPDEVLATSLLPLVNVFNLGSQSPWHLWVPALAQNTLMTWVLKGEDFTLAQVLIPLAVCIALTLVGVWFVARMLRQAALK